jgi:hypothetical protein
MSQNNTRIALYTHISQNFSDAAVVFKGDNQRAESFENGTAPWIYVYIKWGNEIQRSQGSPNVRFVQVGVLAAKLYVRNEDGEGLLDQLTDAYKNITRCKQIDNITIWPMKAGPTEETEKWQVRHLYAPFESSNIHSILPT